MGTKNNPGKFDCHANADPDEPLFTLLARDKHAPTLVYLWSVLRELDQEEAEIVDEARACCLAMIVWATERKRQVVGLGQACLAGMMDLIRQVNVAVAELDAKSASQPTLHEFLRRLLAVTTFEKPNTETK